MYIYGCCLGGAHALPLTGEIEEWLISPKISRFPEVVTMALRMTSTEKSRTSSSERNVYSSVVDHYSVVTKKRKWRTQLCFDYVVGPGLLSVLGGGSLRSQGGGLCAFGAPPFIARKVTVYPYSHFPDILPIGLLSHLHVFYSDADPHRSFGFFFWSFGSLFLVTDSNNYY